LGDIMKTFCRKHMRFENIVGFNKDNPVLACGIEKERTTVDDRVDKCRQAIQGYLTCRSISTGAKLDVTEDELLELIVDKARESGIVFS